jgi:ligand-binding sensor domain-containing protein
MDARKEGVWVVGGGLVGTGCPPGSDYGAYWFSENQWKSFNKFTDPIYNSLWDKCNINVAVDPNDGKHAFVGMRNTGLIEYGPNGSTAVYNSTNSTIRPMDVDPANTWIGGVDFDLDGNLWVLSNLNSGQLAEKTTGGQWRSFNLGAAYNGYYMFNLIVDSYNQKWCNARGAGLVVFNENDPSSSADNQVAMLTTTPGKGGLPTNDVYSIVEDHDQAIWVGSSAGVFVIYNPGNIFSGGNYDAQKILIEQDGHAQYLLETEIVTAIAVDGANRKWFGTFSSGVYLMSPDGTKLIHAFNTDNSPLPSNSIASIAIDPVTGEVFFGTTDKGICSYRADATEGGEVCDNYYVYPNPVRHDYHGPIAITGLVANASVKITDVSGQVVYQSKANGGQAVWNGNNFDGERAQTGVYIVFVTNDDGSETCITKMVFTN